MQNPGQSLLHQRFRLAYGLGIFICIIWPIVIQVAIGAMLHPQTVSADSFVTELGYTFTGLTVFSILFVHQRWKNIQQSMATKDETQKARTIFVETILYASIFELCCVYGIVYYALGGPNHIRYGRTFTALPTILFLLFVPRWKAWNKAITK